MQKIQILKIRDVMENNFNPNASPLMNAEIVNVKQFLDI